jgi:hypothetical protein
MSILNKLSKNGFDDASLQYCLNQIDYKSK